jgi:hypothetical protein
MERSSLEKTKNGYFRKLSSFIGVFFYLDKNQNRHGICCCKKKYNHRKSIFMKNKKKEGKITESMEKYSTRFTV